VDGYEHSRAAVADLRDSQDPKENNPLPRLLDIAASPAYIRFMFA